MLWIELREIGASNLYFISDCRKINCKLFAKRVPINNFQVNWSWWGGQLYPNYNNIILIFHTKTAETIVILAPIGICCIINCTTEYEFPRWYSVTAYNLERARPVCECKFCKPYHIFAVQNCSRLYIIIHHDTPDLVGGRCFCKGSHNSIWRHHINITIYTWIYNNIYVQSSLDNSNLKRNKNYFILKMVRVIYLKHTTHKHFKGREKN